MKNDEKQTKTKKNHEKLRKTKRNDEKKWFTHFCCKLSFVAITRLLGGHFLLKFGAWGHKNILMDRAEKILDSLEGGCLSGMRAEEGELLQQDFGFDVEEHTDLGIKSELC